ncbi:aminotransferase class I/II-fold pyridoxal phosphate-dependent enzyme [Paraglaciecola sp. L1A13]|uniref:aminotransferase class I/II-fold pyridoxal phosphate-dependent enzyme n=1 Tax=Paraglaciecola sp. L1A13 TaxID=2686359 RepID=UPI00131BCB9E|nr:aminotransferase class I/II-fold pyridoxal phosphate-dependent enzyme [Paraglaciecola sp. L1A13]|tara:strand:- start:439 stop:723 length:285 start_codon:yes stop_codon:yes gene_type:complete
MFLQAHLPPLAHVFAPSGGLVLWLTLPKVNTQKLAASLAQQNVYVKAGNLFSTTTLYKDCLRINMGNIPNQSFLAQLRLVCELASIQENSNNKG